MRSRGIFPGSQTLPRLCLNLRPSNEHVESLYDERRFLTAFGMTLELRKKAEPECEAVRSDVVITLSIT